MYLTIYISLYFTLSIYIYLSTVYISLCLSIFHYMYPPLSIYIYLTVSPFFYLLYLYLSTSPSFYLYPLFFYLLYIFLHLHLSIYISLYLLLFIYISHTCSLFLSMYLCPTVSHPPTHYPHIHIVCGNCMEPRAQKYLHAGISQYNFAQILAFSTTWVFMCYTGEHHHHIHAQDTLHMC